MLVPRGHPWIVVRNDTDLLHGYRGFSVRIRVENGGNQKANFVCNNTEGLRNTSQGSFELSL